nr:MAG TPA: hypothetical protein [Caudoviricetes sp.]
MISILLACILYHIRVILLSLNDILLCDQRRNNYFLFLSVLRNVLQTNFLDQNLAVSLLTIKLSYSTLFSHGERLLILCLCIKVKPPSWQIFCFFL